MEKEPTRQSKPLTREQLDDVLEHVKGQFLTARVELCLCVGDFAAQVAALVANIPAVLGRPWPPAGRLHPVTYRSAGGELVLVPTDLAEHGGASYVAPYFYVVEEPRPGELTLPLACYGYIGGKLHQLPELPNDKLLAAVAKHLGY